MARRNEFDEKRDVDYADGEKASGLEDGAWQGRRMSGRVAIEHVKRTDYEQTRRRAKRKRLLVDLLVLLFLLSLIGGMVAGVWFLIGRYTVHYTTADVTYTVLFDEVPDVLLSGHHLNIERWRREESLRKTLELRPDLLVG